MYISLFEILYEVLCYGIRYEVSQGEAVSCSPDPKLSEDDPKPSQGAP